MNKSIRDVIDAARWLQEVNYLMCYIKDSNTLWEVPAYQELHKIREFAINRLCLAVGDTDED